MITAIKVLTLPMWIGPWLVVKAYQARATVRAGRRTHPVRIVVRR